MKLFSILLLACLLVVSIKAYSIPEEDDLIDKNEDEVTTDYTGSSNDNAPTDKETKSAPKVKESDSKSSTTEKTAETKSNEINPAETPADSKSSVDAANLTKNPTPSEAENKANADPNNAKPEKPKHQNNEKKEEKKEEKAVAKSDIMELVFEGDEELASEDYQGESNESGYEPPANNGDDLNNSADERPSEFEKAEISEEEAPFADTEAKMKSDEPESPCNVKYKKIGCFKAKNKKLGFQTFLSTDPESKYFHKKGKISDKDAFNSRLPQMVCDCANAALDAGNAVFSLKNIAECWTGPDDTIYDKEGPSKKCVTFDNEKCDTNSPLCSGKRHASFVYYVDSPEHTKTPKEIKKELAVEEKKRIRATKKKLRQPKQHKTDKHKHGKKKHH